MRVRLVVFVVIAAVAAGPGWAGEGNASRGAAYAGAMCASCHSISADKEPSPNTSAPPLRDMTFESGEALEKFFNTTHPSTGRGLKDTQADDILSYVDSLKAQGAKSQ